MQPSYIIQVMLNEYLADGANIKRDYAKRVNWTGMDFPSGIFDLKIFESINPQLNLIFHVYTHNYSFAERYRTPPERVHDLKTAKHVHLILAPYEERLSLRITHHWYDEFILLYGLAFTILSNDSGLLSTIFIDFVTIAHLKNRRKKAQRKI